MIVPYCDLSAQHAPLREGIHAAVDRVLDSCAFNLGEEVLSFEKSFATALNVKHVITVSTGSDAVHLALLASGVGRGDEVIVPALTFTATAAAVEWCGAKPICVDIDDTGCLCARGLAKAVTKKTRAVIPVHLYGQPAAMDEITAIAKAHKLVVIEDAAQAHLARYHGRACGTLGDAAAFSFYPTKNLGACGEGGAVATNNDDIAQSIRELRDWGNKHQRRGFNNRMHAFQAAILSLKLKELPRWTALRQAAARRYEEQLAGLRGLEIPKRREETEHVFHQFAVLVRQRKKTIQKLTDNNIGSGIHYPRPLHLQPCFADWDHRRGDFPMAEKFAKQEISLPLFAEIKEEQIAHVCETLRTAHL